LKESSAKNFKMALRARLNASGGQLLKKLDQNFSMAHRAGA
jgi:hypothetical protein